MNAEPGGDEIAAFVDKWVDALVRKDLLEAASLRHESYTATTPDGAVVNRDEEVAMISLPSLRFASASVSGLEVDRREDRATVRFEVVTDLEYDGQQIKAPYQCELMLEKSSGHWRALQSSLLSLQGVKPSRPDRLRSLIPDRIRGWIGKFGRSRRSASLRRVPYIPYAGGGDYVIGKDEAAGEHPQSGELPLPPPRLWLGYNYPAHGRGQVERMLDIVRESGFRFAEGDRILDLGCGAGRMIRHLQALSESCEIWGADISAEHIQWCRDNLSPPFHFLTNTMVPHLPFADHSFRFIYCGSLFTHIDDLATGWLLELNRLLAADGRLYVTLHDQHTIRLFDHPRYADVPIVERIRSFPAYKMGKDSFAVIAAGRGDSSQVFFEQSYFTKMAAPAFDTVSVTPAAYFYQTAYLLKPRQGGAAARPAPQ